MLHKGHIFFVADRWIAWRVLRHIVAITICFIPMNIHMHWNARMMEDYKKTHEWWVNVPRQVAPKHQQSLSVPAMTASTNLTPKVVVEQNKHEKTSYISGIMIKKAMKVVSFPKAWLKTKNRQLSLSCAWDGHCLPSVSPRLSETYCFRKNRGFNAKGEPSEKNYKSNWCCAVERLEGFINMSTGMICIYFYVFAAKIGWAYGCWPKETKHHQGWSRRKQRAESQCTCFQMIGSCLFLPRSLGRWSNLTKATAVFNCIETTYIINESMAYRYSTFPFSFGSLLPQNNLSKEYLFVCQFCWFQRSSLGMAGICWPFCSKGIKKTPCLLRLRRDHPRISVAPLWRVAGSSSHDDRHAEHLRYIQLG